MHYLGAKQRVAKHIIEYLNQYSTCEILYEPFVGACNVGIKTNFKYFKCSDIHPDLILMWQALQKGWIPPKDCTETEYQTMKLQEASALRGFIGFGVSFSGKWFGGYARDNTGRNYTKNAFNSVSKKIANKNFYTAEFKCINFLTYDWSNIKDAVFYCDPPYLNTTKYSNQFNHDLFWEKVRELSKFNVVVVSEYQAPADFKCVLEIPTKLDMHSKLGQVERIERLFEYVRS